MDTSLPPSHECDALPAADGDDLVPPPVIPHQPHGVGRAGAVAHHYVKCIDLWRGLVTSHGHNIVLRFIRDRRCFHFLFLGGD